MDASVLYHPASEAGLPLAAHVETFVERLARDRYLCHSLAHHVDSIARWMSRSWLKVEDIDEAAIQLFLDRHLPRCALCIWETGPPDDPLRAWTVLQALRPLIVVSLYPRSRTMQRATR